MSDWQKDYRKEASEFHTEAKWTVTKFLPTILLTVLIISAVGFGARSLGLWGGTVIERKVFENSYQRSEAIKSEIAQQEATIAILEEQERGATGEEARQLQIQIQAAKIRLETARREQ